MIFKYDYFLHFLNHVSEMISEDNYKIACDLKFNFTFSQSIPVSVNFGVNVIKCILLLPANCTAFLANFHI